MNKFYSLKGEAS